MKKSLTYLPQNKIGDLKNAVSIIRKLCDDVEMIILFGSYARGDWKEETDLKPERKSGHKSDYDILVVVKEKSTVRDIGIWSQITKKCDDLGLSTHVRIIAHDIQYINIQLAEGHYFFVDIKKEGCLLYDSGNFRLARKRKLKPEEEKRIAQDYYDEWFESAIEFYEYFKLGFQKGLYKKAAFMLHQVTEASYKAILLVFSGENPHEHYLSMLSEMAAEYDKALPDIFPIKSDRNRELFELLDNAYIGARFIPEYRVTKEDLEYLSGRVKLLLELTEKICKKKIKSFKTKDQKKV